jgi:hypothetical protein
MTEKRKLIEWGYTREEYDKRFPDLRIIQKMPAGGILITTPALDEAREYDFIVKREEPEELYPGRFMATINFACQLLSVANPASEIWMIDPVMHDGHVTAITLAVRLDPAPGPSLKLPPGPGGGAGGSV